jgi:hypothetical protein
VVFEEGQKILLSLAEQPSMVIFGSFNQLFCTDNFDLLFVCFKSFFGFGLNVGKAKKKVKVCLKVFLAFYLCVIRVGQM